MRATSEPPVELIIVLGILLGLVCIIAFAAYLAGRSAGFSRALTSTDWSTPTERLGRTDPGNENSDI